MLLIENERISVVSNNKALLKIRLDVFYCYIDSTYYITFTKFKFLLKYHNLEIDNKLNYKIDFFIMLSGLLI
jgi:hypothetical protein